MQSAYGMSTCENLVVLVFGVVIYFENLITIAVPFNGPIGGYCVSVVVVDMEFSG